MKFKFEHTFKDITLEDWEQLLFDEDFSVKLFEAINLSRTLVSCDRDDKKINRVVRLGPKEEIPRAVQEIVKVSRFEYDEHIDYAFGSGKGSWKAVPNVLPGRVTTVGTFTFTAVSGGVKRTVEGDTKVNMFGVGKLIEKYIIANIEKSYEESAAYTQKWIAEGKHRA